MSNQSRIYMTIFDFDEILVWMLATICMVTEHYDCTYFLYFSINAM